MNRSASHAARHSYLDFTLLQHIIQSSTDMGKCVSKTAFEDVRRSLRLSSAFHRPQYLADFALFGKQYERHVVLYDRKTDKWVVSLVTELIWTSFTRQADSSCVSRSSGTL